MKLTHAEGSGSILKSRFARGMFPLVAALLASALAVPMARAAAVTPPDQLVLIDTSASAGSVVASSSSSATYSADHAFDGNWADNAGRWLAYTNPDNDYGSGVHGETPMYLVYRFNAATKVNVLRLRIQNANEWDKRSPKAWTFLGSHDGETWTTLDTRSGVAWASGTTVKTFAFENETKYEYYKFNCTEILGENDYLQIYELQFLYDAGIVLTDLTTATSGSVSSASGTYSSYPAAKAFDGNKSDTNGRWLSTRNIPDDPSQDGMYLVYHFNTATAVNAIRVWNGSDSAGGWDSSGRAPKAWAFSGSNDGTTWTTLDTQTSETGWAANGESRYYQFANNTAYSYYKFNCTALNDEVSQQDTHLAGYLQLWELEFYYVNTDAPKIGNTSLVRTGVATYSLTAEEDVNAADISYILSDGETVSTNGTQSVAEGDTETWTIAGLAADKTYQVSVLAVNNSGTDEKSVGTLYTGELSFGDATDANEYGLVAGGVTVARASADPFPLTVNYTISGSAGTEGTTWAAPVAVTIPANEASAVLPVVPLMDGDVTSDVAITVALASGNYELPASNAATLTLVNLAAPPGKKTWVATANGNASDGANWSPSGAPTATDEILFDGNFSNARCIWDAAATHTVAAWEQASTFTGVVELQTTYESGAFAALAITGDCTINGGTVTQTKNEDVQVYRISMTVGGDLTVAAGAQITATGKGYDTCHYPAGSACGVHGGSANDLSLVYGNLKHPVDIGSAGSTSGFKGGGAIHLVVTGDATIDGTLAAQPSTGSTQSDTRYKGHGAGGSIYITAASVAGSGSITAAGYGFSSSWQRPGGAGGRIAVICTTAESLSFPTSKMMCNGSIASYGNTTGAGTIFVKTASQQNGTLIVDNAFAGANFEAFWPTKRGVTPIPAGETWTLDEIQFRRYGVLCVPEGTTLSVPLSGISATSDRTAGILYEGGTLNIGSAPYTLTGKWTFQADAPYTFDGDVTVTGGANIGGLRFSGNYLNDFAQCDVTVDGDLTIASDGYASATMAGPCEANTDGGPYPRHGGQYASLSGNRCYGSVFAPVLPGYFAQAGDHATVGIGGGVLKLTVTGDLVVDGSVTANSAVFNKSSAAAGSVNITAKTLSGSGSITANGAVGAIQWDNGYNGVGGRIAVRVTDEDVGTTGVWTKFAALGCATNQIVANGKVVTADRNQNTSAGTIYLQGKSDGEKGGTIYVKNKASYDTSNVATWIPAAARGDAAADFANAKLVIADRGVVAIGAAKMKLAELTIEENSLLDLHGEYVRVKRATVGGTRLAGGKYTAATLPKFLKDSGEGGVLDIGGGFSVIVR